MKKDEFIAAFAEAVGVEIFHAQMLWNGVSHELKADERRAVENGGAASGQTAGHEFLRLYPHKHQTPKIMIHVSGGVVQEVRSTVPDIEIELVDEDNFRAKDGVSAHEINSLLAKNEMLYPFSIL